ncbi:hypothetical protein BDW59DRAFT_13000 [Aspergillus cavernicola]|uniref:Uncharacterized protein n=1 Tax=Aspergillus cavernicola TaxID=176166 RepID=A0ABR4HK11_9EURO
MSQSQPPSNRKTLRPLSRYITTHNPQTRKAIFSPTLPESMPIAAIPDGADFSLAYTTSTFPTSLSPIPTSRNTPPTWNQETARGW